MCPCGPLGICFNHSDRCRQAAALRGVRLHMKILASGAFVLLLAGCAALHSASINPGSLEENGRLMSEPTPADWKVGSVWSFVQLSEDGSPILDVTLRVTNKPATTCSSGDWRELELVDGQVGDGSAQLNQAYSVSGRLLTIDLTGWCDVGEIQGALTNSWFVGQTTGGPFPDRKFVPQRVVGRRLR